MEIIISILGAISAITVAVVGAILSYRNSNSLQVLKLKEEHYIHYIEALHNLASDNAKIEYIQQYTFCRDRLLVVGSEEVVKAVLAYEKSAVGQQSNSHDEYLTKIIKSIRKDLKLRDRDYPQIHLKK